MCAVNPSRVSTTFSDAALHEVVDNIAPHTASLLEIVNYNVEVSLTFSDPSFLVSYASTGSTICLCRRTHRFADYDKRSELSDVKKIDLSVLSFPLTAIAASPAMGLARLSSSHRPAPYVIYLISKAIAPQSLVSRPSHLRTILKLWTIRSFLFFSSFISTGAFSIHSSSTTSSSTDTQHFIFSVNH